MHHILGPVFSLALIAVIAVLLILAAIFTFVPISFEFGVLILGLVGLAVFLLRAIARMGARAREEQAPFGFPIKHPFEVTSGSARFRMAGVVVSLLVIGLGILSSLS